MSKENKNKTLNLYLNAYNGKKIPLLKLSWFQKLFISEKTKRRTLKYINKQNPFFLRNIQKFFGDEKTILIFRGIHNSENKAFVYLQIDNHIFRSQEPIFTTS